jgi:putative transposase
MCYHSPKHTVSYHRHRFPAEVIQHAVWLYFRFPLSFRDVEDLLAQRGIDVSYETVRRWSVKFGVAYARKLRRSHPPADTRWHLDEVFVSINGRNMYLWRAVDCEGEALDVLVQSRRNKRAALKLMRKCGLNHLCQGSAITGWPCQACPPSLSHLAVAHVLR